jgi:hypothetical protein
MTLSNTERQRRADEIEALATEVAWERGCRMSAARGWARSAVDELIDYALAWDDRVYAERREVEYASGARMIADIWADEGAKQ